MKTHDNTYVAKAQIYPPSLRIKLPNKAPRGLPKVSDNLSIPYLMERSLGCEVSDMKAFITILQAPNPPMNQ